MAERGSNQRLMAIFLQELQERTTDIDVDLVALNRPDASSSQTEVVQRLLRSAHSLKGAAGLVGLAPIEMVCHRMEDLLIAARDAGRHLDDVAVALLLRSNDALADAGRRLRSGDNPPNERLETVGKELSAAMRASPHKAAAANTPPPPATDPNRRRAAEPRRRVDAPLTETSARVSAARLDAILRQSGELVIAQSRSKLRMEQLDVLLDLVSAKARARVRSAPRPGHQVRRRADRDLLTRLSQGLQDLAVDLERDRRAVGQAASALHGEVRRARLQPFTAACAGLERLVRDLAGEAEKETRLEISSGETELDRTVAEGLQEILRHLVRNAVDHGIERPDERQAAGKPRIATIRIAASLVGDALTVSVSDDGRGVNTNELEARVRKSGTTDEAGDSLSRIFLPGVSTSPAVTTTSGRGVGLDIVRTLVERMRGAVAVSHRAGHGATFTLTIPTQLGTIRALLVRAADRIVAIETSSVARVIRGTPAEICFADGRMLFLTGTGPAPALELRAWLGMPVAEVPASGPRVAVLLNEIGKGAAVLVDAVLAEQELLVRTIGPRLQNLRDFNGGTILPDGTIALLLNAAALGDDALNRKTRMRDPIEAAPPRAPRILIADDSLTTRTLEKTVLEGAGYDVAAAADGAQAWQMLVEKGADLVLADVDMPGMDGFALTERIRGSADFRELPIILLTSRETEDDKRRGFDAGADAYLVKSAFDSGELLKTIAELV